MTVSRETLHHLMTQPRPAQVLYWEDGDTCRLEVDCGFGVKKTVDVRLIGYDAPEEGNPGYEIAKGRAEELAPPGSAVIYRSFKPRARSFARWLGHVYYGENGESVATTLTLEKLSKADFA